MIPTKDSFHGNKNPMELDPELEGLLVKSMDLNLVVAGRDPGIVRLSGYKQWTVAGRGYAYHGVDGQDQEVWISDYRRVGKTDASAPPSFDEAFSAWFEYASELVKDHYTLEACRGQRYIKIVSHAILGSSTSAWAFIDQTNGDVLKPASWKTPAKHARGNIYNLAEARKWLRWTGPMYLR